MCLCIYTIIFIFVYICLIFFLFFQLEPFFIRLALFDAQKGLKISEDFNVDLNETNIRSLLPKRKKLVRVGLDYQEVDYDEMDEEEEELDNKGMDKLVNDIKEVGQ